MLTAVWLLTDAERPEVPECVAARDSLLQRIAALDLPANFLDELVHQLGGPGELCHSSFIVELWYTASLA